MLGPNARYLDWAWPGKNQLNQAQPTQFLQKTLIFLNIIDVSVK